MKDYKLLYEGYKYDLAQQVTYSSDLQAEIDDLKKELEETKNSLDRRERIALTVHSQGWAPKTADDMMAWIGGITLPAKLNKIKKGRGPVKGVKRGTYKKKIKAIMDKIPPWEEISVEPLGAVQPVPKKTTGSKRAYTKKAKFWGKKKKK